jgi:glucuronosyltransferase
MEAVYYGKPIIGIPIHGDQHFNVKRAVQQGHGLMLELNDITIENLNNSINTILENKR